MKKIMWLTILALWSNICLAELPEDALEKARQAENSQNQIQDSSLIAEPNDTTQKKTETENDKSDALNSLNDEFIKSTSANEPAK